MNCATCSGEIPDDANFCGLCGAPQPEKAGDAAPAVTRACAQCGEQLPRDARFCGACGTAQPEPGSTAGVPQDTGTTSLSRCIPAVASDGSLDFGFAYPLKIWRALDPECAAAYEIYESHFNRQWQGQEQVLQYGYFTVSGGRRGLEQQAAKGIDRAGKLLQNFVSGSYMHENAHRPRMARYFYRDSFLNPAAPGEFGPCRVIQQTYVRAMKVIRYGKDEKTYPPAPIANLVVAMLPGRVAGRYACSLENPQFVADPKVATSRGLLDALNSHLLPALQDLWRMDADVFGGDTYRRGEKPGGFSRRWAWIEDGLESLEPIFAPTLFQTDVLNPAEWYNEAARRRPSELRAREFAAGLMPCGQCSLFVVHYPTSNVFDRRGAIIESHLRLDVLAWMVGTVRSFLNVPASIDPAQGRPESDLGAYLAALSGSRRRGSAAAAHPQDVWLADQLGRWRTEAVANHPVLPVELALHAAATAP
jgi:hypothetical protein